MINVNFSAYGTYVTDSVYQWDVNQVLKIKGLGLSTVPEVHFNNADMDRAIVRQATLDDGAVLVTIPNSVLQSPLPIYAYVGIYSGNTFKVIETVRIPVKPRTKPEDYKLTDTDDEVYSFKALENAIANANEANSVNAENVDLLKSRVDNLLSLSPGSGYTTKHIGVGVKVGEYGTINNIWVETNGIMATLVLYGITRTAGGTSASPSYEVATLPEELTPYSSRITDGGNNGGVSVVCQDNVIKVQFPGSANDLTVEIEYMLKYPILGTEAVADACVDFEGDTFENFGEAMRGADTKIKNLASYHVNPVEMQNAFINSIEVGKGWNYNASALSTGFADTTRARVPHSKYWTDVEIIVNTGYKVALITLDSESKCVSDTGWKSGVLKVDAFTEFIANIRRDDNGEISSGEVGNAVSIRTIDPRFEDLSDRCDGANVRLSRLESEIDNGLLTELFCNTIKVGSVWNYNAGSTITSTINSSGVRAKSPVTSYLSDITITPADGYKFSVILLDESLNCESETGWITKPFKVSAYKLFALSLCRSDGGAMGDGEVLNALTLVHTEKFNAKDDIISSTLVEYGRLNGASYVFVRIPKTTNGGNKVIPKLKLTSEDGSIDGAKRSTLRYSIDNDLAVVMNGGLFDTSTNQPIGQTIINGVSIVNEPHPQGANGETISDTECYPLCIDADGNLSAPYDRNVDTADMIADGIIYAVSGWGKLVENYVITEADIEAEIVHPGRYCRQAIGQYQNGDYCICTVDMSGYANGIENEAGLTYTELAQIFVNKGVKFAYSLDGGGSAETVIGKRQLNAIYEGTEGRIAPTVFSFELE